MDLDANLTALLAGRIDRCLVEPSGATSVSATAWNFLQPCVVLPGSFNPLHQGHWQLAEVAGRLCARPAAFELSIENVDKPLLPVDEVKRRVAQFAGRAPLWLTRAPTFLQKSRLFPGATFVVGFDTAERIIAARYYAGGEAGMRAALSEIAANGCGFLVAGRTTAAGRFCTLSDLALPAGCGEIFRGISQEEFAADISSTELRRQSNLGS